ncbi:PREDICTED: 1-phosphatidylinositol 4,5-bisphosphate phosphodiesterase classes I and II-like isoform X2 [Priapulus caudatus]|uniref:1-phosphatidylinositol 4,5-bisphosphate phosphodiesterase n=1 Tax=Priapulus caudatus TaxID=37621 RepID=A0ABM1ERD7_PRICU|nr:PREDICTED: 1-phosphatidylinositol 4,5-bisphosphate phosphodiesterase classes I and II-like isoform X2 [Priapulus caudatus]
MGSTDLPIEDKTVTIVHGPDFVNVDFINFVSNSKETAKEWAIEIFKMAHSLLGNNGNTMHLLDKAHTKLCTLANAENRVPVRNIVRMFAQHKDDKKRVEKALEQAGLPAGKIDSIAVEKFTFDAFFMFYKHLTGRAELHQIFRDIGATKKPYLLREQLVDFLNNEQRDPRLNEILYPYFNVKTAQQIIDKFEPDATLAAEGHLSQEGLLRYLMSDENHIVAKEILDQSDDLTQPLSHYFIHSSHNTYLTGHQLTGKSSVEIYRQVLLSGCRCVELDCWEREEEPIITHGYTMCTEILFKEVVEAIAESAFKTSDLPVILSFENHTTPKTQEKIARYCKEIFGDALLTDPLESNPLEPGMPLPSPHQMRGKIIVKNKKRKATRPVAGARPPLVHQDTVSSSGPERKSSLMTQETIAEDGTPVVKMFGVDEDAVEDVVEDDNDDTEETKKDEGTASQESEAGAELSALVNYFTPTHFRTFEASKKRGRSYEISSFVESQATNLLKEYPVEFVNYNKRQCSRIYPKGTRVDSSNYMPQMFWNAGCQFVALNFQTLDLGMQLNLGMFEYNGKTGYLLKPEFMRRADRHFDPFCESTVDGIIAGSLTIKVISGQFLSDKRCGTYVEVDMFGLPCDTKRKQFRTKTVPNNGINAVYNEEPFVFKKIVLPDLACVRIAAYEDTGKLIGHRVIPIMGLRPGYRHMGLRNESDQPLSLPSALFLYIKVRDYVPDAFADFADALANPIAYQSLQEKHAAQLKSLMDDDDDDGSGGSHTSDSEIHSEVEPVKSGRKSAKVSVIGTPSKQVPSVDSEGVSVARAHTSTQPTSPQPQNVTRQEGQVAAPAGSNVSTQRSVNEAPTENGTFLTEETIETLLLNGPSLASLQEHKDYAKATQKQQKEIQQLLAQHERIREERQQQGRQREEKMKAALTKERSALEKSHNKSLKKVRPDSAQETEKLHQERTLLLTQLEIMHDERMQVLRKTHAQSMISLCQDLSSSLKAVHVKHHTILYDTLDKLLDNSLHSQHKALQNLHDREVSAVMERSQRQGREEKKKLTRTCNDKAEISRRKREIEQKQINRVVSERHKLLDAYEKAKQRQDEAYKELSNQLEREKLSTRLGLEKEVDDKLQEVLAEYSQEGVGSSDNANESQLIPNAIESTKL